MVAGPHGWAHQKRSTILLVEDDSFQASARKSMLERRFTQVDRAESAADALILVGQPFYLPQLGLVIIDLHMPGMRGPVFVSELKSRISGIPILVLGVDGERARDYEGLGVHFLPSRASTEQMLATALRILTPPYSRVA